MRATLNLSPWRRACWLERIKRVSQLLALEDPSRLLALEGLGDVSTRRLHHLLLHAEGKRAVLIPDELVAGERRWPALVGQWPGQS